MSNHAMSRQEFEGTALLLEELGALRLKMKELETENAQLRHNEKILLASGKRYRTIFENTGTATILIEDDMTISMANTEFENFSGYLREEVEGRELWTKFVAEDDLERVRIYHRRRRAEKQFVPRNYECRLINYRGEVRTCYMTAALIPGTKQSVASFMDITETIRAKEALRDFEEKFTKTFRSSPDTITVSTLSEGRFLDVNDTFCKMTGYAREETIGYTADELKFWPNADYRNNLIKLLLEEGKIQDREIEFHVKSGEKRIGLMSAEIADLQGEVCMLSAFIDITRQQRLEKEILRIREIERQKIGHDLHDDLGQHLIGIMALSTLLEQRLEQNSGSEKMLSKEISSLIRDAISKTRNLARGLCPVKIEENGFVPALREFAGYVHKIFGVSCVFDYDERVKIEDQSVATHLYHIVQESINNAIRHGKARHILIFLAGDNDKVTLSVSDNGTGLPDLPARQKGLGLNIMRYRAKRIGATLEIHRNTKGGTNVLCKLNLESLS